MMGLPGKVGVLLMPADMFGGWLLAIQIGNCFYAYHAGTNDF